jgi:hypothetical protein
MAYIICGNAVEEKKIAYAPQGGLARFGNFTHLLAFTMII